MSKTDLSAKSNRSHASAQLQNDGVEAPDLLTSSNLTAQFHALATDLLTSSTKPADVTLKRCQISRYDPNAITIQRRLRHS
ncbi:protein trichome birefringence-like 36 [Dorcoceras hygrometricum]|uniref:Protein trichome birefringence-like 36 n=1 Tax=Dorcoceras hygrometricum TaxID=472368 RepID=A0A2Z7AM54_9LAMI|nr:protein trichome birefringence-like 36 [Dorcoceras hygrometricum]